MPVELLGVGEARTGWLYDGDRSTPDVSVTVHRRDDYLVLTIPWRRDSPYERWFGQGINWGDDPTKTKYRYTPPSTLWFESAEGPIVLVGCHAFSAQQGSSSVGQGHIDVDLAIAGGLPGQDYALVNGLQSAVPGFGLWLGQRPMDRHLDRDPDGRLRGMSLTWARDRRISVSRRLNLTIQPGFEFTDVRRGDGTQLREEFQIQTLTTRPRPWLEHLRLHSRVRDLVAVASWDAFELTGLAVTRDADPLRTLDQQSHGRQWLRAEEFVLPPGSPTNRRLSFLFQFDDIGTRGIGRWLRVRDRHIRAVDPLIFSLRQRQVPLETHVQQLGAAVEALGYELAIDAGESQRQASGQVFIDAATRVRDALGQDFADAFKDWPDRIRSAFRAVKHPEHPLPDPQVAHDVVQDTRLVLRLWIARRLGTSRDALRRNARLAAPRRLGSL